MTEDYRYTRAALRLLARHHSQLLPRRIEREKGISAITRAMRTRARRQLWRRVSLFAACAALLVALVSIPTFGLRHSVTGAAAPATTCGPAGCGSPSAARTHGEDGIVDGRPFAPGQTLVTSERGTVAEFGPITHLALDEESEVEYRQGDFTRRFGLVRGAVQLRVAKLRPDQRFVIETPDAEVEVRGTVFGVALAAPDSRCATPRTRVAVAEGAVEVRFGATAYTVRAGESWPAECAEEIRGRFEAQRAPVLVTERAATPRDVRGRGAGASVTNTSPPPTDSARAASGMASDLAAQNDLFAKAVSLKRAGRSAEALAAYQEVIGRYPSGALAESASAERLRLLIRTDPVRAQAEARSYLSRYPRGIASHEAEALLSAP